MENEIAKHTVWWTRLSEKDKWNMTINHAKNWEDFNDSEILELYNLYEQKHVKEAVGSIYVQVNVNCPYCDDFIDLLDEDTSMQVEKSDVMIASFEGDEWGCKDANIEVQCPECRKEFIVNEIQW